jgi:subtilase family serine protease
VTPPSTPETVSFIMRERNLPQLKAADAFFTAASKNIADTVSTSWGESEVVVQAAIASGAETPAYVAAFDEAFLEPGIQGQSGFDAAGDAGAYDDSDELGTTGLVVDTPADSPFMTAAGGPTLPWTGQLTGTGSTVTVTVPHQRTARHGFGAAQFRFRERRRSCAPTG